jgi:hypothetical protein
MPSEPDGLDLWALARNLTFLCLENGAHNRNFPQGCMLCKIIYLKEIEECLAHSYRDILILNCYYFLITNEDSFVLFSWLFCCCHFVLR